MRQGFGWRLMSAAVPPFSPEAWGRRDPKVRAKGEKVEMTVPRSNRVERESRCLQHASSWTPAWWACGWTGTTLVTVLPTPGICASRLDIAAPGLEMLILDTDIMVDLLRGYPPAVAWLESLGEAEICS